MSVRLHQPLPDETWQSVVARHQQGWSRTARSRIAKDLLGSARAPVAYDHPRGLKSTIKRLPPELHLTPEKVLLGHTNLTLHRPFLPAGRWKEAKVAALADRHVQFILGIGPSRITRPYWLRLCPKCFVVDRRVWGTSIWHRTHQAPGAWVCPTHQVPLWETDVRARRNAVFELVAADDAKMVRPIRMSKGQRRRLAAIAADLAAMLNPECPAPGPEQLQATYRAELKSQGLLTRHGRLKHTELCRRFVRFYGDRLLVRLGCQVNPARRDNWLDRVVHRPHWHTAPLRHVLFARFLGPDTVSMLQRALSPGPIPRRAQNVSRPPRSLRITEKQIARMRQAWLRIRRTGGGNLREKYDPVYSWLWRYDRAWLHRKRRKPCGPRQVDGRRHSLDRRLAAEVRAAACMALKEDPRARLSRRRIAERTSRPALVQGNPVAMPLTMAALRQVAESVDACAIRRLRSAARTLPPRHRRIRWRLVVCAGLGSAVAERRQVRRILDVLTGSPRS